MVKSVLVKGPVSRGSSAAATEVKAGPAVLEIITGRLKRGLRGLR